jgi:divalent metal cation (Fe/Co/Zn/Cd) transporter
MNVVLFGAKVVASLLTGSMVVLVSTLDSALDLLSGGILFLAAILARKEDPMQYPLGKQRMEPIGIVIFSTLMVRCPRCVFGADGCRSDGVRTHGVTQGMSAVLVLVEAIKLLADDTVPASETETTIVSTAIILSGVVLVKGLLYVLCKRVQQLRGSSTVEAYTDDHRNDAISNAVGTIAFCLSQLYCTGTRDAEGVCPKVVLWWIDPATAVALSLLIVYAWVEKGQETLLLLVGQNSTRELHNQLVYAAACHEPESVLQVGTGR